MYFPFNSSWFLHIFLQNIAMLRENFACVVGSAHSWTLSHYSMYSAVNVGGKWKKICWSRVKWVLSINFQLSTTVINFSWQEIRWNTRKKNFLKLILVTLFFTSSSSHLTSHRMHTMSEISQKFLMRRASWWKLIDAEEEI